MYKVFNMGHRLEVYLAPEHAQTVIDISRSFNIDAQIVGRIEEGPRSLAIKSEFGDFHYLVLMKIFAAWICILLSMVAMLTMLSNVINFWTETSALRNGMRVFALTAWIYITYNMLTFRYRWLRRWLKKEEPKQKTSKQSE